MTTNNELMIIPGTSTNGSINEEVTTMRTATWGAIGKGVEECTSMEQVLAESGLDYEVTKESVYWNVGDDRRFDHGFTDIPNRFITVNSKGKVYDVVSDKFEVVQNRDAFDFVNYMGEELSFEKAGETQNGTIYVIGKLPQVNILGDIFTPHVIFRNGFSGKVKITAAICPLRIVCQNQFNFAFKNASNAVTIRHVQNAEAKLQEAREVLRLNADYMAGINVMAEQFVAKKVSPKQLDTLIDWMFPIPAEDNVNAFKRNRLEVARAEFATAYNNDDNGNFRGTAWGVVNAYADFITHKQPTGNSSTKEEGRFLNVTFRPAAMNTILDALEFVA